MRFQTRITRIGLILVGVTSATAWPFPASSQSQCSVRLVGATTLALDSVTPIYVEPEVVSASGDKILVMGSPTYGVPQRRGGAAQMLGALYDTRTNLAEPIYAPRSIKTAAMVRAAPRGIGKWLVVFAELDVSPTLEQGRVTRLWQGVLQDGRWSRVTPLPSPRNVELAWLRASNMATDTAGAVLFAVPAEPENAALSDLIVYEFAENRWSYKMLGASEALYASVAPRPDGGFAIAVVKPDLSERADVNSLFIYGEDPGSDPVRVARGLQAPVHEPHLLSIEPLVLSWWVETPRRAREARALLKGAEQAVVLDSSMVRFESVKEEGRLLWIIDHVEPGTEARTLHFLINDSGHVRRIGIHENPFTGPFDAVVTPARRLLLVGPALDPSETPPVTTLISNLQVKC